MVNIIKEIFRYSVIIALSVLPADNLPENTTKPKLLLNQKDLDVNLNDNIHYKTQESEKKGIKELSEISKNAKHEDSWLYLPENKTWYEIGKESSKKETDSITLYQVKRDKSTIESIINKQKPDSMIFYHTHPYFKGSKKPSEKDITNMIETNLEKKNINIRHKIVSGDTLTKYNLTKRGEKYFQNKNQVNSKKVKENLHGESKDPAKYNPKHIKIEYSYIKDLSEKSK